MAWAMETTMARPPTAEGDAPTDYVYGQPTDQYDYFVPWYAETKLKTPAISGFKLHISVSEGTHDPLAREILPRLRDLQTHHKVILGGQYTLYNVQEQGASAGKFITIYAGPVEPMQQIVDAIDPVLNNLCSRGIVRPGPHPWSRQSLARPHLVRTEGGPRQGLLHAAAPRDSLRTERGFLTQREQIIGRSGMISGLWLSNLKRG